MGIALNNGQAPKRHASSRLLRALAAFAALAVVTAACSSSGTTGTNSGPTNSSGDNSQPSSNATNTAMPDQVRTFSCCVSGTEIPVWIAFDENLFAKYGLNMAPLQTLPPPSGGLAVLAGSMDIGNDSPATVINAVASGNDQLEWIAGKTSKPVYRLMSNTLTDASQIKGKRLGVSGKFAAPAVAVYAYLKAKYGYEPDKDYTVVPSAKISDLVPALANNTVDVAVLSTPLYLKSQDKGAKVIADLSGGDVQEGNSYIFTTKSFAEKYPAAVEAYLKAIIDAMAIAKNDKATAIASIKKHQDGISDSDAETTYEQYVGLFDPNMYTPAFKPYLDYPSQANAGNVDVQKLMDLSFLQKLDKSGFLKDHGFTYDSK